MKLCFLQTRKIIRIKTGLAGAKKITFQEKKTFLKENLKPFNPLTKVVEETTKVLLFSQEKH